MHTELIQLLRRREAIIADHAWRDRDAAGHLEALKAISGAIQAWEQEHDSRMDAKLRHFLGNASFGKALEHAEALAAKIGPNREMFQGTALTPRNQIQ